LPEQTHPIEIKCLLKKVPTAQFDSCCVSTARKPNLCIGAGSAMQLFASKLLIAFFCTTVVTTQNDLRITSQLKLACDRCFIAFVWRKCVSKKPLISESLFKDFRLQVHPTCLLNLLILYNFCSNLMFL
jgi:hypothetical protein